jgi:hypothetical protein
MLVVLERSLGCLFLVDLADEARSAVALALKG